MSMVDLTEAERKIAGRLDPGAANALEISRGAGGISFTNAGQAMEMAKMMALSNSGVRKHLRGNPGACLAIVVQAVEWGVSAYAVANKSYFVNDQIAFESQLVQAVILRRAPIRGRIKFDFTGSGMDRQCRAWARDRDDPEEIYEVISPKVKDIPVKNSPLWKGDPDQQLSYYSGRALCRRHFPDVLLGIYVPEELEAGLGTNDALKVPPRDAPLRGLQSKLDALAGDPPRTDKVFTQADVGEAAGEVIDHDAGTPANDDAAAAGVGYEPLLADLHAKLEEATTPGEIDAAMREAGWIDDAPTDVQERAAALADDELTRIDRQAARDAAEDPHASLKISAREKASQGAHKLKLWAKSLSDADADVVATIRPELDGIAAAADRGRA